MKKTMKITDNIVLNSYLVVGKITGKPEINSETLSMSEFLGHTVEITVYPKIESCKRRRSRLVLNDLLEFTKGDSEIFLTKISEIFGTSNKERLLAASLIRNSTFKSAIVWLVKRHGVLTAAKLTIDGREVITPLYIK